MIGAICGDIIGSVWEGTGFKAKAFPLFGVGCRFTDDTVLTIAVARRLLFGGDYVDLFHAAVAAYPEAGYGAAFGDWATQRRREPYGSWGNGGAMRVCPIAFACDTLHEVLAEARRSAAPSHSHPDGIRGAQATAAATYLARTGATKSEIRSFTQTEFGYDLSRSLDQIRPGYAFDVSAHGSVPQSIAAFLDSNDYEDAVRGAISLGGDADTMATIAGGIAEAFYRGVPEPIRARGLALLDDAQRDVVAAFADRFDTGAPRRKASERRSSA